MLRARRDVVRDRDGKTAPVDEGDQDEVDALFLAMIEANGARIATIALTGGRQILVAIAADTTADKAHSVTVNGRKLEWRGPVGRFDGEAGK